MNCLELLGALPFLLLLVQYERPETAGGTAVSIVTGAI